MLRSSVCRYQDFLSPWYREWADRLALPKVTPESEKAGAIVHRKHWEFCAIGETLRERGMLETGRVGCGFAVGREFLPSAFAAMGARILATDQPPEGAAEFWTTTGQHAASLDSAYWPHLINREDFDARVRFGHVDMRELRLPWPEQFDFIWSSCAIEHLGSLEAGLNFVLQSMALVKPGGLAVHTTEYNVTSNDATMEEPEAVIYRRRDIEDLDRRLRAIACGLSECDFFAGDDAHDLNFDHVPYYQNGRPHVKVLIGDHVATSFLLIIRKGVEQTDITVRHMAIPEAVAPPDQLQCETVPDPSAELAAQAIAGLQAQLSAMQNSASWKVTAPLRGLKDGMTRVIRTIGKPSIATG